MDREIVNDGVYGILKGIAGGLASVLFLGLVFGIGWGGRAVPRPVVRGRGHVRGAGAGEPVITDDKWDPWITTAGRADMEYTPTCDRVSWKRGIWA